MKMTCDNDCTRAGWIETIASCGFQELHISYDPNVDTDDTFYAFCHDEQEMLTVNGWNFTFEKVTS